MWWKRGKARPEIKVGPEIVRPEAGRGQKVVQGRKLVGPEVGGTGSWWDRRLVGPEVVGAGNNRASGKIPLVPGGVATRGQRCEVVGRARGPAGPERSLSRHCSVFPAGLPCFARRPTVGVARHRAKNPGER